MKTVSAIAAFAGVAAATSWGDFPSFKTPKSNNNKCEGQQQGGWGWGNLGTGGFSSYDGFDFSGFTCSERFDKRDPLTKRSFQPKVIEGSLSESNGPSFKCGNGKDFSATKYQLSVSRDTDVEMHYSMPDGTTCKQTAACKKGGTVVENKQCGGAKEVKFKLPQGSREKCDLGIHYVDFDCNPPPPASSNPPQGPPSSSSRPPSPPSSQPAAPPSSSKPADVPSSSRPASPPTSSPPQPPSSNPPSPPSSSAPPPAPPSSSTPGSPVSSSRPGAPSSSAPVPPPSSCGGGSGPYGNCSGPPDVSPPSSRPQPPASSQPQQPPQSSRPPTGPPSSAPQPPPPSSSGPVVPPPVSSSTPGSPLTSSRPGTPPPTPNNDCPNVLPQCLNTWIRESGCRDNSDFTCFCKNSEFTKNVIQCVTAYGADTTVISKALSYLQGICAAFIPQNPGLVTDCPKDIPITPPAAVSSTPSAPKSSDTTTVTTQVVTEVVSTCTPGQVITDNGNPTTLTTLSISTITITQTATYTTCGACNGAGAPPPAVPKYTTIIIADTYTVPCTYSEGVSQGFPIPDSSTITQLTTSVTVPLLQFTTAEPVQGQTTYSVGLADGPAPGGYNGGSGPAPETTAAPAPNGGYGSGPSTTFRPSASRSSAGPVMQTVNAAPKLNSGKVLGLIAGGAMAVLAL